MNRTRRIERYSECTEHSQQRDGFEKNARIRTRPAISRSHLHRYRRASSIYIVNNYRAAAAT